MKKIGFIFIIIIVLITTVNTGNTNITTKRKSFFEENNVNNKVSHRTLALASALAYMPIPASCKLDIKNKKPCYFSNRSIVVDQFNQYINLHNYATTDEMDGWNIVDYTEKKSTIANVSAIFNAYTLEKDNNIIIALRGTDFTDLLEWIQHLSYARDDIHAQESLAEEYVLEQAKKYKDHNIYITGHSLGGYLTQIGAAALQKAILNGQNQESDWQGFNLSKKKYDLKKYLSQDTNDFSEYKDINFVQAVSFDGMGLLFNYKEDQINAQNEKIKILLNLGKNEFNESRLINYTVKGDIVSSLGLALGEERKINAALDSASYHKKNYKFLSKLNIMDGIESLINLENESKLVNDLIKLALKNSDYTFTNLQSFYNDHIKEDIVGDYNYYGMNSVIGYLNLTHEADEFACLLDGTKTPEVKIMEEKPWLLSTQANYIKSLNKDNSIEDIITNEKVSTTLRAMTYNACARKYEWYECTNANKTSCRLIHINQFDLREEDTSGKVVAAIEKPTKSNTNTVDIDINNVKKYYFVRSYYNDNYTSKETIKNSDGSYSIIDNGSVVNHENYVDSKVISIISDTEKPNCKFDTKSIDVQLKAKLLSYESKVSKVTLTCTDNISGFKENQKVYKSYFRAEDDGLIPSITIDDVNLVSKSNNKLVIEVTVRSNRVPIYLTPKLVYTGYIKDKAGNNSNKISVDFNITEEESSNSGGCN